MPRKSRTAALLLAGFFLLCGHPARAEKFFTKQSGPDTYTVCQVDPRQDVLRLFWKGTDGKPCKTFDRVVETARSEGLILSFASNAGMYEPDFSPVGLFMDQGQVLHPLNLRPGEGNFYLMPNGVFAIADGLARVVDSRAFPQLKNVRLATQSGPLLVSGGRIHPQFRPGSTSKLYRNGVGVNSAGQALFVISETPINLHTFARFFRDELGCPNALFFDGTVSSLYAPSLQRNDRRIDLGPIIGVVSPVAQKATQ